MSLLAPVNLALQALGVGTRALSRLAAGFSSRTPTRTTSSRDTAAISPQARRMGQTPSPALLQALLTGRSSAGQTVSLAELLRQTEADLADLQAALGRIFSSYEIDTANEILLSVNENGRLVVTNGHPDGPTIERALAEHPEIADDLRRVLGQLTAAQAVRASQTTPGTYTPASLAQPPTPATLRYAQGKLSTGDAGAD